MRHNIGIIGNGFVGSAVSFGFGLHAEIRIYDKDPNKSTHSLSEVVNLSDFIFVSVPTPMDKEKNGVMDTRIINSVFDEIARVNEKRFGLAKDKIFIVKSTVIPGTMEGLIERYPQLNIIHSPEFLTERAARLDFINASRIVLGGEAKLTGKVKSLFRGRFPHTKIIETDVTTAQFIKYMANCFFATKVTFMNEMRQAADALAVDWAHAMSGFVSDGRIGNSHLDVPGHDGKPGFGGKCFPKDLNAFINLFESMGISPSIMKAVWKKNLEVRETHDWEEIEGAVSNG
tara:strand:- start:4185 stop:5045 length:861 start_codon:yes stop_codon:yes gene_type:complete